MRTAIITGVTGQDGAYLSELLVNKGYRVVGLTRNNHAGNISRLIHLNLVDRMVIRECDLADFASCLKIFKEFKPDEIYNLAAQSSVGLSFEQPIGTIQYNIISVLNILESVRFLDLQARFYQASSSEMFGIVKELPVTVRTPMHPVSPYAISKAAGFWTVNNYRESYGLFACNGILFNHESPLRENTFFVKKVIMEALKIRKNPSHILLVGNIDIKRDFGYSKRYVEAIWLMLQRKEPKDFIICSGVSISLKSIIEYVFEKLSIPNDSYRISNELYRPSEISDIYGDNEEAMKDLGWEYRMSFYDVLDIMIAEAINNPS